MKFLRRLEAPPNPLLEQYTAATGRAVADAVGDTAAPQLVPVDTALWQPIITALSFFAEHPGVPDHTTPGFPAQARTEGDLQ